MRQNTDLNLKNTGGQELVDLQQEKRGFGEEEYFLERTVCVLWVPLSSTGEGWVRIRPSPPISTQKGGALRKSLRVPWGHCELPAVWEVYSEGEGILPEDMKCESPAADEWAGESMCRDWPALSGFLWKDVCVFPFCWLWTAHSGNDELELSLFQMSPWMAKQASTDRSLRHSQIPRI